MKLQELASKLGFVFKPFARMSDMALHAVGYRENVAETEQPIPVKLAVRSALLLPPIYIAVSFLLAVVLDNSGVNGRIDIPIWGGLIFVLWSLTGFLLAPLQVRRVLRLNRRMRRHRLGDLERMAKRETAIQHNAPDLSRYNVNEASVQIVIGS